MGLRQTLFYTYGNLFPKHCPACPDRSAALGLLGLIGSLRGVGGGGVGGGLNAHNKA